jgi:ABC-type transport system involved in multi-copper enzyme maturation permease subunit
MNNAAVVTLPAPPVTQTARPVNQLRITRSEWIKFSSLRSNWISLLILAASIIGLGALVSYIVARNWSSLSASDQMTFDAIGTSLVGVNLAQLIVAVLGVLIVTGEYSNGMIRASLAAVPKRFSFLVGKMTMSAAVTFVVALGTTFVAFLIGQQLLGSHGVSLDAPHVLRAIVGASFFLMSVSVISSAFGFITRSTAGGIAAVVALLLVLPVIGELVPYDWATDVLNYLPGSAGDALLNTTGHASMSVGMALITLVGWMAASIAVATILLRRRDV